MKWNTKMGDEEWDDIVTQKRLKKFCFDIEG